MTAHDKTRLTGKVVYGYYADPKGSVFCLHKAARFIGRLIKTFFILIENKL